MQHSSIIVQPVKTSEENIEAQKQNVKILTLDLDEDERSDYNLPFKKNSICDIQDL